MLLGLTKRRTGNPLQASVTNWWTFDEPALSPKLNSVNSNSLTLQGFGGIPTESRVAGLVNFASQLSFDSSHISASPIDLGATSDWTVVGVVRTNHTHLGVISQINANHATESQWRLQIGDTGVLTGVLSSDGTSNTLVISDTHVIWDNNWHTYIFWRDTVNNLVGLQVDGNTPVTVAFSGTIALFEPLVSSAHFGSIGSNLWISGGGHDETGTFNKALSTAERAHLYNGGAWRTYATL